MKKLMVIGLVVMATLAVNVNAVVATDVPDAGGTLSMLGLALGSLSLLKFYRKPAGDKVS
jgi:hypothetical protein